ncbi:MAG: CAP domain-containing protein [Acidimicrobiia bacterium]
MFRKVTVLTLAAAVTIVAAAPPVSAAAEESGFVSRINSARAGAGLNPLDVYWDLTDDARVHTAEMVEAGEIFHSSNLGSVTSGWFALGENVGVGGDVAGLHEAFMSSSGHRANILGDYNYVGVGTAFSSDSYLYVTVIFMKGPDGLVSASGDGQDPPEEESPAPPAPAPTEATAPTEETAVPIESNPEPSGSPVPAAQAPPAPAPKPNPSEPEPTPRGGDVQLILDLVSAGHWPLVLPNGLTLV